MAVCPDCQHDNAAGVVICIKCGTDLYDSLIEMIATKQLRRVSTRKLTDTTNPMAPSPSTHPIVLQVRHNDQPIAIERHGRLILGRNDPNDPNHQPDIDMSDYQGAELGVSRKHVVIDAAHNPPLIIDLGSYNGTYINGQKLMPEKPYPLRSGDELRLGRMVITVYHKE